MSVLTVMPGPGFPTFGSLDETMANRSPFGSHEKSKTVSDGERQVVLIRLLSVDQPLCSTTSTGKSLSLTRKISRLQNMDFFVFV